MEERFEKMICANCGKRMRKGITGVGYRQALAWLPGDSVPGVWKQMELLYDKNGGNAELGKRFTRRFRTRESIFFAWYCEDCELMTIDTKIEMEEA